MFDDQISLQSPTGALLNLRIAHAKALPRGIVLVQHGLAEHTLRYGRMAGELAAAGFAVYAHDHRGHGSTSALDAPLRRFAQRNGPKKLVADCHAVRLHAEIEYSGLPVVVFGHSMGGLIAMNYGLRHSAGLSGLGLWNSGFAYGLQEQLAVAALAVEKMLKGSDTVSLIFAKATTEAWAASITPRRTRADWLTHDEKAVDAFLSDPLCGWIPTISMAADLIALVKSGTDGARRGGLPASLPVHCLGGSDDPSTKGGRLVGMLADTLRLSGSRDVLTEIVEGARHEALNEVEPYRGHAVASLFAWLDRIVPQAR